MADMYLEMTRIFFLFGGAMALIIGGVLFVKPELVARMSKTGNKWYSSRKSTKPLDIIRDTDAFYFKYNLVIGIIMLIVSLLALYLIIARLPTADAIYTLSENSDNGVEIGILVGALRWILIITITLGLPVWGLLAFAPDRLAGINQQLNRWVSTRLLLLPLERMNNGFDVFVLQNNRGFGAFFVLGGLFILFRFLS